MKLRGKKATEILGQTVLWVILIASLLIFSVPFFFMITNSFEEFSYVLPYPPKLFPTRLDFSAYRHILSMDIFPTALANSVINTVITVMISVFVSTLSAYGFACIRFPGRDKLFAVYLFTLMMPGFLNIIPQFLVLKQLTLPGLPNGLIGTRAGLILIYVATNVCGHTFFLRNFFRSLPSSLAESVLLDGAGHFGMNEYSYNMLMKMMSAPNGIIYITGPTGSGKTTTLYMVLQHLSQRPVNISTIEDPVEKDLPNITQTSVNVTAGMTFAVGLRALLRQDPDIIMIGETRDAETAEISVRSAITGHLVVSTLHTNDAISSIVRLADMGVAPYLISNSVVGIVAQRLVRKVCQFCKYEEPATADDIAIVGDGIPMITRGKGCKVCNNTGYKGRISIHEMVYIDKTLKRMIAKSADSQEMLEYAKKTQGMRSLLDSAIDLVKEGVTTPEEVMKIAYYSD